MFYSKDEKRRVRDLEYDVESQQKCILSLREQLFDLRDQFLAVTKCLNIDITGHATKKAHYVAKRREND